MGRTERIRFSDYGLGDAAIWDGSAWTCASETPPLGCTTIGDICHDRSIFAGDTNLYVTDEVQSTSINWASVNESNTGSFSNTDGAANQAWIVANRTLSQYQAFELCENLFRHGRGDWYLPARDELAILRVNRTAIGGFAPTGSYWSSTESSSSKAWYQAFYDGGQWDGTKSSPRAVRCVRRN